MAISSLQPVCVYKYNGLQSISAHQVRSDELPCAGLPFQ